jgi:gamma-polyglutamate biosynthesis protein CapA
MINTVRPSLALRTRVRAVAVATIASLLLSAGAFEPSATFVLLGDVMLGRGVALAHAGGEWRNALQSLAPVLQSADVALANLESPLDCETPGSADPRSLLAPAGSVEALTSAGLDVVSLSNNHARDGGEHGSQCTRDLLTLHDISYVDSSSILFFTVHGVHLAILAADFSGEIPPHAAEELANRVGALHQRGNFVVVSLHWGMEYQSGSDEMQKSVAQTLAQSGADILWGHHPHAVQETLWIGRTLVLYSLGNAVFDQGQIESTRWGEMVWVQADRSGVRFFAEVGFSIDPQHGRTGSILPTTFRFSQVPTKR